MRILSQLSLLFLLLAAACQSGNPPKIATDQNGNEDFPEFLGRFFTDTAFQFSRVAFPLKYVAGDFDSLYTRGDTVVLTRENFPKQIPPPENSAEVRQEMKKIGDMVVERLIVMNAYYTERRFLLRDGKWYLIYYSGLQGSI
jgi:hypothetical protein